MSELHLPWLQLSILIPFVGALCLSRVRDSDFAHKWSVVFAGFTLVTTFGAWQDFAIYRPAGASDPSDFVHYATGRHVLMIDALSAPLLPLAALLYVLTAVATLKTKIRRFSFAGTLASEAVVLATFSTMEPWILVGLLAAGTVHPFFELRARGRPTRVFAVHMSLFLVLLLWGCSRLPVDGEEASLWAIIPLVAAVFIRCGIVPVHCWVTDLFENATFGTSLLFMAPMVGAYTATRLVLPIAPDSVLHSIGVVALITAVYTAGMALIQREARRFFCYLLLSHSALVLVGLESVTSTGLTGALCVWLSVGLALGGFGLTLRSLEARSGRLSLVDYHGLYNHTPTLAVVFLLTGLASVGFPGTFGFVGTELLVDGAVQAYPYVGIAVVIAAALNGIAVVQVYFVLFLGARHISSVSLRCRPRESVAVLTLAGFILVGGLFPQPMVASRHRAATVILAERQAKMRASVTMHAPANAVR